VHWSQNPGSMVAAGLLLVTVPQIYTLFNCTMQTLATASSRLSQDNEEDQHHTHTRICWNTHVASACEPKRQQHHKPLSSAKTLPWTHIP
jgi:hypothetical protein